MKPLPKLHGRRVQLRLPAASDVRAITSFFRENAEHFRPTDPTRSPEFFTDEYWAERVGVITNLYQEDRACNLFIFPPRGKPTVLGYAHLSNIIRGVFQACYLGYALDAREQGKGLMTEALELTIEFAWKELNLHRIMANYMPWNERSGAVLRRLGFTVEGYARDYLFINGKWQDHIMTALHNPSWKPSS